jgi:hypothetical protein
MWSVGRGIRKEEANSMRRFIITGAPGAGKTAIIRQLELDGFSVVEEAATDVIAVAQARGTAEPWTDESLLMQSLICRRRVSFAPLSNRMTFSPRPFRHLHGCAGRLPWICLFPASYERTRAHQ